MSIWDSIFGRSNAPESGTGAAATISTLLCGGSNESLGTGPNVTFTLALVILAAHLAKVDGTVSRSEIDTMKRVFRIPPDQMKNVGTLFDQVRCDTVGYAPYAKQIARMFRDRPEVLEHLLDGLFAMAGADGTIDDAELDYLRALSNIFGLHDASFARLQASRDPKFDPYAVLGAPRDVSEAGLRSVYRRIFEAQEPKRLLAQGIPEETVMLAQQRQATLTAAYDMICKAKGFHG